MAVAVNPVTNKIYVADCFGDAVTEIDGATDATSYISVGNYSLEVAVNPVTNKIYVSCGSLAQGKSLLAVIDGASNSTTTLAHGNAPYFMAVNSVTNKIYVINDASANVT